MKLKHLISCRKYQEKFPFQIVYEWEDVLARELGLRISGNVLSYPGVNAILEKYFGKISLPAPTSAPSFSFVMEPKDWDFNIAGKRHIVPAIIDFWYRKEKDLREFARRYRKSPVVLITSAEACEYVKANCPGLNVRHWPLSVPDKYVGRDVTPYFDRPYDCAVVGRPNKMLSGWLERYASEHADFVCVYNSRTAEHANWYVTSKGEVLGDICKTREEFFQLISSARVGLYATPGMDDARRNTNGFNQVTPRFLEYVASGCHVIARYPQNPDTDYYEMETIAPHVETYEAFAKQMDAHRKNDVDHMFYNAYLLRHSTSARARDLKKILEDF